VRIQDHDTYHRLDWENLYFARFLNLNTLDLCVRTCTDAIAVMQHSEFPSLKEFSLYFGDLPWAGAEQLFRALSQCKASQTLERIDMVLCDQEAKDDEDTIEERSLTAVKQFLCFTHLQTLRLFVDYLIFDMTRS